MEDSAPQRNGAMAVYTAMHIGVSKMKECAERDGTVTFDEKMCYELDVLALFLALDVCVISKQPEETNSHIIGIVLKRIEQRYGNRAATVEAKVEDYAEILRDKQQLGDRICAAWKHCELQLPIDDDETLLVGDIFQNFQVHTCYVASLQCFLGPLYVSAITTSKRMDLLNTAERPVAEAIRDEWNSFEQAMKNKD